MAKVRDVTPLRVLTAVPIVTVLLVVTGCAGEQPSDPAGHPDHSAGPTTDHAGGHGPDSTDGMPEIEAPPESADWNLADAEYLTMMVGHHSQAIDMTELAATRASDPRVRSIAESIDTGQGREILVMVDWLVDHDLPEPTVASVAAMNEMGMPGMLTPAQLDDLAALDGAAFDRAFLEDMIQHHQGALLMAEDVVATGRHVSVVEWATEVIAGQQAEIDRMRDLLLQLP